MTGGPPEREAVGTVTAFDPDRGWGVVSVDGVDHPFHSTAVADGSRMIRPGTAVACEVVPGRMGRWEASALRVVAALSAP